MNVKPHPHPAGDGSDKEPFRRDYPLEAVMGRAAEFEKTAARLVLGGKVGRVARGGVERGARGEEGAGGRCLQVGGEVLCWEVAGKVLGSSPTRTQLPYAKTQTQPVERANGVLC